MDRSEQIRESLKDVFPNGLEVTGKMVERIFGGGTYIEVWEYTITAVEGK